MAILFGVEQDGDPKAAYTQRAQRFPIQTPLEYRASGETAWSKGATLNISRSGVFFRAQKKIDPKTVLEMRILFPAEITGGEPANVVCWGPVVRMEPAHPSDPGPALAAAILKYRFTREQNHKDV